MFNRLFTITALSILLSTSFTLVQAEGIKDNSDCEQRATGDNRTLTENNEGAAELAEKNVEKKDTAIKVDSNVNEAGVGTHKDSTEEIE